MDYLVVPELKKNLISVSSPQSEFEFNILRRVFFWTSILGVFGFGIGIMVPATVQTGESSWLVMCIRAAGLAANLLALFLYVRTKAHPKWLQTLGIIFALSNAVFVSLSSVLLNSNYFTSAITLILLPAYIALLQLYSRAMYTVFLGVLGLFLLFFLRFVLLPDSNHATPMTADTARWLVPLSAGVNLLMDSLLIFLSLSVGKILYHQATAGIVQLELLAYFDHDSKLPNNRNLELKLAQTIQDMQPEHRLVLVGLRLDGISELNAKYGYESANHWLIQFSQDLSASLHHWIEKYRDLVEEISPSIYRIETGLFLYPMLRTDIPPHPGTSLADELQHLVAEVLRRRNFGELLSFFGAYASYPRDAPTPDLLRHTVLNMLHQNDASTRHQFIPFNAMEFSSYLRREELRSRFLAPGFGHELSTVFQPKVSTDGKTCLGFEALVRWNNQTVGAVPPSEFIPLTESSSAIITVTDVVLQDCMKFIRELLSMDPQRRFRVSFNLSPALLSKAYMQHVVDWVAREELAPWLEVELTEGVVLKTGEHISKTFVQLKKWGWCFPSTTLEPAIPTWPTCKVSMRISSR